MANAISSRTVQKGLDPRDFALVAFGGAGPLHGAEVARALGIPEVIVPAYPGITSAVGLLTTDLKYDAVRTEFQAGDAIDLDRLNARLRRDAGGAGAAAWRPTGLPPPTRRSSARATALCRPGLRAARPVSRRPARSGSARPGVRSASANCTGPSTDMSSQTSPIEIVNIRVTGIGRMPKIAPSPPSGRRQPRRGAGQDRRAARSASMAGSLTVTTPFYRREPVAARTERLPGRRSSCRATRRRWCRRMHL